MPKDKLNGNPEEMREASRRLQQSCSSMESEVSGARTRFEQLASEDAWDDGNHASCLEQLGDICSAIQAKLQELDELATRVAHHADKYEEAMGG